MRVSRLPVRSFLPRWVRGGFAVFAAMLAPSAFPQADASAGGSTAVEARLRRLEETVRALQAENSTLRRELGIAGASNGGPKPSVAPSGKETRLAVGGMLQAQAEFGDAGDPRFVGANDRFFFRRARLHVSGAFAEHFEFKLEGEFGAGSLTPGAGLRASANEVYVGWTRAPFAQVRFGQLKPAFGAEQLASDSKLSTIERFLGSDRLTDGRQIGFSVGGEALSQRVSYLIVIGNGNGANSSGNDNNGFMQTARVTGVVFDAKTAGRLVLGANALRTEDEATSRPGLGFDGTPGGSIDNLFAGRRHGWGVDATWGRGPLDLSAEWLEMRYRPRNAIPASRLTAQAWHLTAAYMLLPNVQGVVRHERFDPNAAIRADETRNWLLGVNYLIKGDDLKLMVDYLFGDSPALPDDDGRLLTRFQLLF